MKLNKKKILKDVKEYYSGRIYGKGSYGLAERCVELGQEWVDSYQWGFDSEDSLINKSPKEMRKELRQYVRARISYSEYNATFFPMFIWMWIAQAIISWIINKILDNILEQRDDLLL